MSTSDNADTPTFAQQVQDLVTNSIFDDKGNMQLPEGVEADDSVVYAAKLEKQRRDTQSAFTRVSQENKKLTAEKTKMSEAWQQDYMKSLSVGDKAELEELRTQDPDAWRQKMNQLEQEEANKFGDRVTQVSQEAHQMTELELREQQLAEFNEANPDFQITDDVIDNDIPPRITKKLEEGKITFAEFLTEVKTYVGTPKKIKQDKTSGDPNFSNNPGSDKPSGKALEQQMTNDYKNEIF